MDDSFIRRYAEKCANDGTVVIAYIEDGAGRLVTRDVEAEFGGDDPAGLRGSSGEPVLASSSFFAWMCRLDNHCARRALP